ncbi:unnamed protein product [Chondrus crispus]|uniref:Galactosyltransferase C-terminal domain-containing protein n=1 Tax=Chondrus crispus TaxID=2769 RepID=R7Q787_CHOCR|nr:unnamed protein product [Chondrus crispus]CDF33884.1 unnamed protein product [Chondrus crispus]|eukprot:XP_005713703.1 unnamed protein product [Chondrus crispus]
MPGAQEGEWWLKEGVTLIAACKDRASTLAKAVKSWTAVRGVHEVLLVDWSSDPPISYFTSKELLDGERFTLVRVVGQTDWVLSRAYNLAARLASYSKLIKVDCDTFLRPDFIEAHPLKRDSFYAGDWKQLDNNTPTDDALHVNGLLYVHRDDFLAVGGYDERITTYGWDDSDLAQRLASIRNFTRFDYNKVEHIAHSASLRVVNQRTTSLLPPENPHAAAVEIQRNRLLLTRFHIPVWSAHSLHTLWNVQPVFSHKNSAYFQGTKGPGRVFEVTAANDVTAVSSLVSDADALDVAKRAVRLILHRYGVQFLPKSLTLDFYKELITKVAFPEHYAEVVLTFRGGCASRLLAYATSNQAATGARLTQASAEIADSSYVWPPLPYRGWRLQGLWRFPDAECSCKFSSVFDAREEEIISTWSDKANPVQPSVSITDRQPSVNVTAILKGFDESATEKAISQDLLRWTKKSSRHGKHDQPRILMDDLACDVDPAHVPEHRRQLMQAQFRQLAPTKDIQETVSTSLRNPVPTILDTPLLAKENWSVLVGHKYATTVRDMFTKPSLQRMAAAWGATALPAGEPVHRLDDRAAALTIAVYVAQHGVSSPSHLTPFQSQQLNQTVTTLSRRIERLFIGCLAQSSTYLEAYPELSLILAGFLSCGTCV